MKRSQARKWEPPRPDAGAPGPEKLHKKSRLSLSRALRTFFKREASPAPAPLVLPPVLPPRPLESETEADPPLSLLLDALALPKTAPEPLRADLVSWASETAEPRSDVLPAGLDLHYDAPQELRQKLVNWAAETAPQEPPQVLEQFENPAPRARGALVRTRQTPVPADPFAALWSKLLGRGISLFTRGKRLARALLGRLRTSRRKLR